MNPTLRRLGLSVAALAAACGAQTNDPVGPGAPEVVPAAPGLSAITAPALLLNSHALLYCYHPGTLRYCVVLTRTLRITSSGSPLKWTSAKNQSWVTLSPAAGTTPTTVTVAVDRSKLPTWFTSFAAATVTISAVGAWDSPQQVRAVVNQTASGPSPSLAFSDSALGFCYSPGSVRNCVRLAEHVLFTSTGASLAWKAVSSKPWIVIQPATGSTDTDVRISVDLTKLPPRNGATSLSGALTVSASGALNSPQVIPVKLQFYSWPPPE
jgi:Viral BACON domain